MCYIYTHVVKEVVSFQGLSELLGMAHKLTHARAIVQSGWNERESERVRERDRETEKGGR